MDSVNACDDKIIRAKAKAMIMKVKKGTVERPAMPDATAEKIDSKAPDSLSKACHLLLLIVKMIFLC